MRIHFHCLHGFWGQPSDWVPVVEGLRVHFPESIVQSYDLFSEETAGLDLSALTQRLTTQVASSPGPRVLLGYSMGGRIALELLSQNPEAFEGAVLFSTHPGLKTEAEKEIRRSQNEVWAQAFLSKPWEDLESAWNSQEVFQGSSSSEHPRVESLRPRLAHALRAWSVVEQDWTKNQKAILKTPTLWLVGEFDLKYQRHLESLAGLKENRLIVRGAGHRMLHGGLNFEPVVDFVKGLFY